jgi:hypothetical protein
VIKYLIEVGLMVLTIVAWHYWSKVLCIPLFIAYLIARHHSDKPRHRHKAELLDLSGIKDRPSKVTFNKPPPSGGGFGDTT